MLLKRRGFLAGVGALLAAPAIIRTPGLLMPVKVWVPPPQLVLINQMTGKSIEIPADGDIFANMARALVGATISIGCAEYEFKATRATRAAMDNQAWRDRNVLLWRPSSIRPELASFRDIPIRLLDQP